LSETGSATTAALAGVAAMADVMKRFDSNGNMLGQLPTTAVVSKLTDVSGITEAQTNPIIGSSLK
jgi:hypothetical protein